MSYFRFFPNVQYDGVSMPDITRSTIIEDFGRDSFFEYTIEDGETPEMLAHRLYKNPEYAAFILLMNDITDPYEDWPLSNQSLDQVISDKYDDPNGIHHYENTRGDIVSEQYPDYDRVPITNFEYEIVENDKKRNIRLVLPELISEIEEQHKALLRS